MDLEAVYALCCLLRDENARMSFTDIMDRNQLNEWLSDPLVSVFGDFDDVGHVRGLIKATRGKGNKSHSVYLAAATHPDHRKMNIAYHLTLFALEALKAEGALIARTYIYSWNKASIATIEKCGFMMSGRVVMHEFDDVSQTYIDDLIFYKLL